MTMRKRDNGYPKCLGNELKLQWEIGEPTCPKTQDFLGICARNTVPPLMNNQSYLVSLEEPLDH
jgi:hypothetical protein